MNIHFSINETTNSLGQISFFVNGNKKSPDEFKKLYRLAKIYGHISFHKTHKVNDDVVKSYFIDIDHTHL